MEKIKLLIDELKLLCKRYSINGEHTEYKLMIQIFLYKYMNDKFGYELKKINQDLRQAEHWEEYYAKMSVHNRFELLSKLPLNTFIMDPQHLIYNLWKQKDNPQFALLFDQIMLDLFQKNEAIFMLKTESNEQVLLFENVANYVINENVDDFLHAVIDKLVMFSFESFFLEQSDFFATIFAYLIEDYNVNDGEKYGEYDTPLLIATVIAKLLVGKQEDSSNIEIYDPTAGTGTLAIAVAQQFAQENVSVFTQDSSQRSNTMLKLNLVLNNLLPSLNNVIYGDTLLTPYHHDTNGALKTYDFVVSNPPFKADFSSIHANLNLMSSRFWAGVPNIPVKKKASMSIYTLFIQHVINSLKVGKGRGVIVVPTSFLTAKSGVEKKILTRIIDDKIIYGCIHMPVNVFTNIGTNVAVLFFDNARNHEEVVLIDATQLTEDYQVGKSRKRQLTVKDIDLLVDVFNNKKVVHNFSVVVSYETLKMNQYSLVAGQYFEIAEEYSKLTEEEFYLKMKQYTNDLEHYFKESEILQSEIIKQLEVIVYK